MFSGRQVRILKIAVIVMGILLVGGFAFVLAAIVYQASPRSKMRPLRPGGEYGGPIIELPVGTGASLTSMSLDGNRLALHLNGGDGPEIVVIDLASGKIVARVRLKPHIGA